MSDAPYTTGISITVDVSYSDLLSMKWAIEDTLRSERTLRSDAILTSCRDWIGGLIEQARRASGQAQ